jgi:nucleoside-diphosphate-sugar epimerase
VKVLVIGGTGPSGPYVVRGLQERGVDVTLLNRGTRKAKVEGLATIVADPHFEESLVPALSGKRFDVVIAMYGRLRLMATALEPVTDRVVSVGGTAYLPNSHHAADEDAPRDLSNKIIVKLVEAEEVMAAAHAEGRFTHTHLRYPLLWGPGQLAPKDWSVVRRAIDGRPFVPVVDGGLTIESRCYVENAAAAVLAVIDNPDGSAGRTYNVVDEVCPDDATRTIDLCGAAGRPDIELLDLPQGASGPAGFWGIGRDLTPTDRDHTSAHHRLVDGRRIRNELGHRDAVSYAEAIKKTAAHYVAHPLERGGAEESKIGDPFDYAAEDAYAKSLAAFRASVAAIPFAGVNFVHQYDHPRRT